MREDPSPGGRQHFEAGGAAATEEPVAIIGMSCRLPLADNPDEFWRLLRDGVDAVTEAPAGRWDRASLPEFRRGGFLADVEGFDAAFFGMSPNEAAAADPQQRLTLELAWEALEHARIIPAGLRGTATGVYVGAISSDYAALRDRLGVGALSPHAYTGAHRAIIANRVSYVLGLRGPSLTLDTGQSSSLVAVHLACESLRRGESSLALAGGVNLNLLAETTAAIGSFGALSPDGRCRVFDAAASGYVRGEGGALVVLKPLPAAVRDGDVVHGVILASAVNNDGGGTGLTAPDSAAQEQVIRQACARAGLRPADVQYVELHGTGTPVGDPAEAAALGAALGQDRLPGRPLLVGSVKTNIGHLEGAAGVAGLLKVALSITHRQLPASLHFSTPSPAIPLDELGLRMVTAPCPWPAADQPPVAGVSSFGMGGTNCHLLLAASPPAAGPDTPPSAAGPDTPPSAAGPDTPPPAAGPDTPQPAPGPDTPPPAAGPATPTPAPSSASARQQRPAAPAPWVLSARSAPSLRAQAARLRAALGAEPDTDPALVAESLTRTRATFEHRAVITGADKNASLDALAAGRPAAGVITGTATGGKCVFTFPGQGSQWPEMARALLDDSPGFAAQLAECAAALRPFTGYSLHDVLRGEPGAPGFSRVDVVQPALWAVMVSLAGLWRSGGVEPDVVIGHSQGEIAAATVAGALSVEDGARVVALRSRAIAGLAAGGGMMSVGAPVHTVEEAIGAAAPLVTVAAVNGPRSVIVSGPLAALAALERHVTAAGHRTKTVPVDYASHSPAVQRLEDEILAALAPVRPASAATGFISALTGAPMDTAELDAGYWYRSLRRPVRFGLAVRSALESGSGLFVECSPHPVLVGAVDEAIEAGGHAAAAVGTLRRGQGGAEQFGRALAEAYVRGANVRWAAGTTPRPALIGLPTYAFTRQRYELTAPAVRPHTQHGPHALGPQTPAAATPAAETALPGPQTRREHHDLVLATLADVLGHHDGQDMLPSQTFKDLGVDSATAIELRNRLRSATGHALPTGVIFDYPTPGQLIAHLHHLTRQRSAAAATPARDRDARDRDARDRDARDRDAPAPGSPGASDGTDDAIAIVGIGCRYPGGVTSPEGLWDLVTSGKDAIGGFPANRGWDLDALFAGDPDRDSTSDRGTSDSGTSDGGTSDRGTSDTRHGGFLYDADEFDAAFFGISPREAAAMDPQQRLLLEICWEAIERAGLDPGQLRDSRTGVFVGAMASDYGPRLHQPTANADGHRLTGTALSVASGRIAYTFGLRGPALTVDTACSSSLVALHLAAQALRRGDCELALAGGVTVMASPGIFVEFSRQHGLAADGRCKAFSAQADGTGWAEGAGVLLLERAADARRNGRRILALVRGSAVNSDGRSNGLTAPNGLSQQQVIEDALADAGLAASDVAAVEAHGTGTTLGDPIEAQALLATYGRDRPPGHPLWLGSVKSNIGHTQAAAGVAGVIKMVSALRHGVLPPTLHAAEPTPHVDWSAGDVRLLTGPVPLPPGRPALAAVSGFGVSGTNAHVIIERPPPQPSTHFRLNGSDRSRFAWLITARTGPALRGYAARLLDFAVTADGDDLAAAAAVLARRARFAHRAVVLAGSRDDLLAALAALANGTPHLCVFAGVAADDTRPVFVFPGQGSQWAGMAAGLLGADPAFAAEFRRCDEALAVHTGWSAADVLRGRDGAPELAGSDVIQPALFAVMASLAAAWRAAGVAPAAVLGHSQGEITAAYVAGALSLPDAARIVALRSKALLRLTGTGGMIALRRPAGEVREMLARWPGRLWLAIESGPAATVVAGEPRALDEFTAAHGDTEKLHRVAIDYAAHTPHIEALREELLAIGAGVAPRETGVMFCSSLDAGFADPAGLTAGYWYRSLRHPVQFARAVASFTGPGTPLFIEASPHPVLTGHVHDTLRDAGLPGAAVGTLRRDAGGPPQFARAAAQAFVLGASLDAQALAGPAPDRQVELPCYPFERQRYWLSDRPADGGPAAQGHPLLGPAVPLAETGGHVLTGLVSRRAMPWLADHEVAGAVLLPGTAFVELAHQAAVSTGCDQIDELIIESPLHLPETGAVQLQVTVAGAGDQGRRGFAVHARPAVGPAAAWTRHASGTLSTASPPPSAGPGAAWPPPGAVPVDLGDAYDRLARQGYRYGPAFQGLTSAWRDGADTYADVALPGHARPGANRFGLHPALLDAALHPLVLAAPPDGALLLPFSWSAVRVAATGAGALRVKLSDLGGNRYSLTCSDTSGRPVAAAGALTLRQVPRPGAGNGPALHTVEWAEVPLSGAGQPGRPLAVIGCDPAAEDLAAGLGQAGTPATLYYDLPSLAEMTGGEVPATVVATCPAGAGSPGVPTALREATGQVLDLIQAWIGDERFAGRRLVMLTRDAITDSPRASAEAPGRCEPASAGARLDAGSLAGAAVWGLVRSAQAEHPGRFGLLDVTGDAPAPVLVAALAAGQPQMSLRDGTAAVPRVVRRAAPDAAPVKLAGGTVLVTGGTGALGALVARRLAERHGAGHLLLASRRGPGAPGAAGLTARLEEAGAAVTVAACDVSDRDELAALLASIPASRPLTGVVHAAGVVQDATVEGLSARHIDAVLAPKADAAWHLHELTRELPVSMFVLFSSVAGVLGNGGQGNYAAANAALDALAAARRRCGLPATSIAWGPWDAEGGMAGRLSVAGLARMARGGLAPLTAEQGLELFDGALAAGDAALVAARWDEAAPATAAASPAGNGHAPATGTPANGRAAAAGTPANGHAPAAGTPANGHAAAGLPDRLAAMTAADGRRLLVDLVRSHVAAVLAYPSPGDVDVDRAVSELGFDSLTAVELRNRLDEATGLRLSATLAFDHPTVTALAGYLYRTLAPAPPLPEDTLRAALDQVQQACPDPDDTTRSKITAILHSALARWESGQRGTAGVHDKIRAASDDEIFALIDNEKL